MDKRVKDTSVIVCIFSEDREKILLIKRRDVPVWVLPGGGIEKDESPENSAIREIKEETGFDITIIRKVGEYTPINRLSRFTHLFESKILAGKASISSETKNIKFFPINALPIMPPPFENWIKDAHKNIPVIIKKKLTQINYKKFFIYLITHPILVTRFLLSRIGLKINT